MDAIARVLPLALVDAMNPTALGISLYLLTQHDPARRLSAFISGVFASYVASGCVIALAARGVLTGGLLHGSSPLVHAARWTLAGVLLGLGVWLWLRRHDEQRVAASGRWRTRGALSVFVFAFVLWTLLLPTAVVFLGALLILSASGTAAGATVAGVVAYSSVAVSPMLALLLLYVRYGARSERFRRAASSVRWVVPRLGSLLCVLLAVAVAAGALG